MIIKLDFKIAMHQWPHFVIVLTIYFNFLYSDALTVLQG